MSELINGGVGAGLPTNYVMLGRYPFVRSGRSDQSVLKKNARVLRTASGQNGPAYKSEPLSSRAPVCQSSGIRKVIAGKKYANALDLNQFFSAG